MDTKLLCTLAFKDTESIKNLFRCHTVFGISRIVHNIIADLEYSAWIIAAADNFRNPAYSLFHALNVSDIIQINNSANFICILKLFVRSIIGGKHNVSFSAADCLGKHKLCHGRAVTAAAIFLQNLNEKWIRCCFYGKKFLKSLVPCKCFL